MSRRIFESSLEKIGRIIAGQYDINVVFEGSLAATDGKTIFLPSTSDLTPELMADMHGFIDHEVSHCRYTDFKQIGQVIKGRGGRFHKELLNATEDGRIERLMVEDFPGCRFNLDPLNSKLRKKLFEKWAQIPWPVRLICTIRDVMDDQKDAKIDDEEIKPFLDLLKDDIAKLNDCTSTLALRELTHEMTTKIMDKLDEQTEEDMKEHEKGDMKEGAGGEPGEESYFDKPKESAGKSGTGKGKGGTAKTKSGEAESIEKAKGTEDGEGKSEGEESSSKGGSGSSPRLGDGGKGDELFSEALGRDEDGDKKDKSEWNEHDLSVDDMVRRDIKAHFGEETPTKRPVPPVGTRPPVRADERAYGGTPDSDRSKLKMPHIPFSTRFDKTTDYSGTGNNDSYRRLKNKVKPFIAPIKRLLERKLTVDAHLKMRGDRERGMINTRALAQLATNKSFNRPFKEVTRKITNNVAVQILIDQSGSMYGNKIETAKMAAIAMGEALAELKINFEITGFTSIGDRNLISAVKEAKPDPKRFNRTCERLEKNIFKSFDTNSLVGIERLEIGAQNPDGEAVRWAADRLMTQKQKRKILIVMSDGQPATGEGDYRILRNDLFESVKKIMKAGIEVIGFGIQDRAVKEFYPDHLVIDKLEELPTKTMTKLASLLGG